MKKLLLAVFVASFATACNHNPQGTGDEILMRQERQDNAIEYQKDSITEKDIPGANPGFTSESATKPATADSTSAK